MQLLTTRNSDVQNPLQDLRYTYDPVGNIVEIYDASKETSYYNNTAIEPRHLYTYDALYRLLSGSGRELLGLAQATSGGYAANSIGVADTRALHTYTQHFAYDELGNIQSIQHQTPTSALNWTRNYVYDGATNRLLKHDENQTLPDYTYDEHGNMLKMPHLQSMHYDYQDQLNKVVLDASGNTAYYIYDAGGQRVRKIVEKGYVREERIYVGGYEVFRKYENSTLDLERSTVHIMDDKNRVALIEKLKVYEGETVSGSEQIRYQYSNHLGSASLELNATGQIISYEEYHPFGTTSYRSGTNETEVSLKRYKYIGKERDEETGLYYYGFRYYAAWIARFINVDPLQHEYPHYTPFQYAGNKPVTFIDLDGLEEAKPKIATNIIIDIGSTKYVNSKLENGMDKYQMGQYFVIHSNSSIDAERKLDQYMKKNNLEKVDNVVFHSHGAQNHRGTLTLSGDAVYAYGYEVFRAYNKGNLKVDAIVKQEIDALVKIGNKIAEGGSFIITPCQAAADETIDASEGISLSKELRDALTGEYFIYLNQDKSTRVFSEGIYNTFFIEGGRLTHGRNFKMGWIKILPSGEQVNVKNVLEGKTGNIIIKSSWSTEPVIEEIDNDLRKKNERVLINQNDSL